MANKCKCRVTGEEGNSDIFIKIGKHYYKSQEVYDEYQTKLLEVKSGIYKITNTKNNKIYIGESMDIQRRWKEHIDKLDSNQHANYLLQNDFNIFGLDNFKFEVLQYYKADGVALTKTRLLLLEQKYISKYQKDSLSLYNIENTLLKLLNGDKGIFSEKGFDYKLFSILVGQIATYKFIESEDIFELVKRNTPLTAFNDICGTKKSHNDTEYKSFINYIKTNYIVNIDKIIKTYKLKYKTYETKEKIIEEVTEYGMTVFKEILENNCIFKKFKKPNKELIDNTISYSLFVSQISDYLNYNINLYCTIRDWLFELDIIKQQDGHTYATEFSLKNNYIINNKTYKEKQTGVVYYSMAVNEECKKYIYDLLDKMTDDEKRNRFIKDTILISNIKL